MPERALVPEPCRCPRKDGGLAQVLQRGTPARGDRPKTADNVTEPRRRSQPAAVTKAENSNRQRSKDWSQSNVKIATRLFAPTFRATPRLTCAAFIGTKGSPWVTACYGGFADADCRQDRTSTDRFSYERLQPTPNLRATGRVFHHWLFINRVECISPLGVLLHPQQNVESAWLAKIIQGVQQRFGVLRPNS